MDVALAQTVDLRRPGFDFGLCGLALFFSARSCSPDMLPLTATTIFLPFAFDECPSGVFIADLHF
jgi:hypothetical protein